MADDTETKPDEQDAGDALAAEWAAMAGGGEPKAEGGEDGDALAAEWAAMAGGGEDGGDSTRVMNQDEIDSLLGFGPAEAENEGPRGIAAILNHEVFDPAVSFG